MLAFLDFHQPQIVAIQETKIDSSIATSELFPESFPYSVYRKDRNLNGGGVMLLIHKDISHMPMTELDNDSESIWVKMFANKTSHYVAGTDHMRNGQMLKMMEYKHWMPLKNLTKCLGNSLIKLRLLIKARSPL